MQINEGRRQTHSPSSLCPWQAGAIYIARKMEVARRMTQGRSALGSNSNELTPLNQSCSRTNNNKGGAEPPLEKSLVDLLKKYPACAEDDEHSLTADSAEDKVMGSSSASLRAQILKRVVGVGGVKDDHDPAGRGHGQSNKPDRTVCVLYWVMVMCIGGLIAFSMWLAVKISIRNSLIHARKFSTKEPFSFDDIFNSSYQPRSFSADWVPGEDAFMFIDDYGDLLLYNITTNETELLMVAELLDDYSTFWVSPDLDYVLLAYDMQSLWRHSFFAKYAIYDIYDDSIIDFPGSEELESRDLQYAGWSSQGHALSFVVGNNLFYQATPRSSPVQLTDTGVLKTYFNGIPDWLYEEEILANYYAVWWSPDSQSLCYAVFNCTNVPMFKFPYYGPKSDVYGDIIEIAYPKSGDLTPGRNTVAQLKVVDLQNLENPHVDIPAPPALQGKDHYFLQVSWRDNSHVTIAWANRVQNQTIHTICNTTGACVQNLQRQESNGWIDILPTLRYITGGSTYLTILPRDQGEAVGKWNHLATVTAPLDEEGRIQFRTEGQHEVKSISAFDSSNNIVYYISTDGDPRQRHLFGIDLDDSSTQCLSCNIPNCSYVSASFSSTGKYYILGCRGPGIPIYWLKHTQSSWELLLEDNADVEANLALKDLPRSEYLSIPIGGGYEGYARVLVPPEVDRDPGANQFALMVETYGGPGSQAVDNRFSIGFETYLASSHNVVYAFLDGRGTNSRGVDFRHLLYKKMATLEMEDQLLGGQWFQENLDYVDSDKNAAIWGWSYGGFLSSHVLANESNVFQCGISGAALIDRRYYDTAHSERYMGFATADDNLAGYERTDITNKVEYFRGKHYLMVHGTADDNVHFASSAQLSKALTDEEIQFRFQLYTDLNHYFLGRSRHLYRLFSDFLLNECWDDASARAREKRRTRVMDKNIKLHGIPDNRHIKNN